MPCKPPVGRQLRPPSRFPASARYPRIASGCTFSRGRGPAALGAVRPVAVVLSGCPAPERRCQRNAVVPVGVKLGAAPDAPSWGEVLVRTPSDRFLRARRGVTSKFTCLSRELPACPAWATGSGGQGQPGHHRERGGLPAAVVAAEGGEISAGQKASFRTAQYAAWTGGQAGDGGGSRRWNATAGISWPRMRQGPHPGKDPL
jgi:hypothetical protein